MAHLKPIGGELTFGNAVLRAQMRSLEKIEAASFASRNRYWERDYLDAVYKRYRLWTRLGVASAMETQLAHLYQTKRRKGSDLIRLIIDCSSQETRPKVKSRWANALRYADLKNVEAGQLLKFFDKHEGVAGCAQGASSSARNSATTR